MKSHKPLMLLRMLRTIQNKNTENLLQTLTKYTDMVPD